MSSLEVEVASVVNNFVANNTLFTALDVSNVVKKSWPLASHREIRNIVRDLFSEIQTKHGYAKTPIPVQLADGTQVEALLYHQLSDSWDLDIKYDAQKRAQTSVSGAVAGASPSATIPTVVSVAATVAITPTIPVVNPAPAANAITAVSDPKVLWNNLFTGVQLFPLV